MARLFREIGELVTLSGAARKGGRRVIEGDLGRIARAAVLEKDGRILWVGPEAELPQDLLEAVRPESISLDGATVIPALVECHTHLIFGGNRAAEFELRNQGATYQEIARAGGGILSTVRATRQASEAELGEIADRRAARFVRQGVATIEIKSGYGLDLESELKMLRAAGRIRGPRISRTFLGAHAVAPEFDSAASYLEHLTRDGLPRVKTENLAERVDAFVEEGYFPAGLARAHFAAAKALGFGIAVHADQLTHSGGAELAVELGAHSAEHLIKIDGDDVRRLAASEVTSVLLPTADLYLKCDYPPARQLIDAGARVALATDYNPGTAPSQDVALVGVLARLMMKMSLAETLSAYTIGAAHALGLQNETGSIEPGKACDLCVLDADFEGLFLEIGRMPVAQVYREGRALIA